MATTVTARPNHYELLGLPTDAGHDDIFAAFRKAMGLFATRPSVSAAQLSVAFETLRNPAKRRAYDEAQGLNRKPEPKAPFPPRPVGASFIASASHEAAVQALRDKLAQLAAPAEPPPPPKATQETSVASFIASSVRGAGEPWPAALAEPVQPKLEREAPARREPAPATIAEPAIQDQPIAEGSPFEWKRPALIAGGLVGAAGLIGALAGVSVRDHPAPAATKADVTIPLPAARPAAVAAPAQAPEIATWTQPIARPRVARSSSPRSHSVAAQPVVVADSAPVDPPPLESAIAEPTPAEAAPVQPVAASLPLPKSVIARTIHRIGYACGSVTSASAVDGSTGVYKVTCSSGQSYQASPVRGRYHFRKLGNP